MITSITKFRVLLIAIRKGIELYIHVRTKVHSIFGPIWIRHCLIYKNSIFIVLWRSAIMKSIRTSLLIVIIFITFWFDCIMSCGTLMLHPFYECIRKLFSCQSTQMRDKPNFAIIVTFRVWRAQNFWHRKTIRKMLLSRTKVFMRNGKIRNKILLPCTCKLYIACFT